MREEIGFCLVFFGFAWVVFGLELGLWGCFWGGIWLVLVRFDSFFFGFCSFLVRFGFVFFAFFWLIIIVSPYHIQCYSRSARLKIGFVWYKRLTSVNGKFLCDCGGQEK